MKDIADKIGSGAGISGDDIVGILQRSDSANCRVVCATDVPDDYEVSFYLEGLGDNNHHPLYCKAGGQYRSSFDSAYSGVRDISVARQPGTKDKNEVCAVFANWSHTTDITVHIEYRPVGEGWWFDHCGERWRNTIGAARKAGAY
jgi:hypothetical protein